MIRITCLRSFKRKRVCLKIICFQSLIKIRRKFFWRSSMNSKWRRHLLIVIGCLGHRLKDMFKHSKRVCQFTLNDRIGWKKLVLNWGQINNKLLNCLKMINTEIMQMLVFFNFKILAIRFISLLIKIQKSFLK